MNNDTFEALAHERRRKLLVGLLGDGTRDVGRSSGVDAGSTLQVESRAHLSLYHSHLPKLEENGFIEWDEVADEIAKGPRFDEIRPLLECVTAQAES